MPRGIDDLGRWRMKEVNKLRPMSIMLVAPLHVRISYHAVFGVLVILREDDSEKRFCFFVFGKYIKGKRLVTITYIIHTKEKRELHVVDGSSLSPVFFLIMW